MAALSDAPYDLVVVGRGLVGSAAARHAAEAGHRVAIVGPTERSQPDVGVYGCHNDEGRITRRLDVDPTWAALASRSMDRYADIEARSGIRFHDAVGCLAVGRAGGPYLAAVAATAEARRLELEALDEDQLRAKWPRLRLDCTLLQDFKVDGAPASDEGEGPRPRSVCKSNIQPDFNVCVIERIAPYPSAVLRELDESNRFVQKSAESTSI